MILLPCLSLWLSRSWKTSCVIVNCWGLFAQCFFLNSYLVWAESFIIHLSVQLHANIACKSGPASWTACTNWLCLQLHSNALAQPQTENLLCRLIQELIGKLICHSYQEVIASLINIYLFSPFRLCQKPAGGRGVQGSKGINIARPVKNNPSAQQPSFENVEAWRWNTAPFWLNYVQLFWTTEVA